MKIKINCTLGLMATLLSTQLYATPINLNRCHKVETCSVGETCACEITASALDQYFYINFTNLSNNHQYQCTFTGGPLFAVDFNGSSFPDGARYQCVSQNCPTFPVIFNVDTTLMSEPKADMKIHYFVPGTGKSYPATFSCIEQTS